MAVPRPNGRRLLAASTVLALGALLLLPSASLALTPNTTLSSPFSGTWSSGVSGGTSGCGTGYVRQAVMNFNVTTGVGSLAQRSYASDLGCGSLPAYTLSNASSFVRFVGSNFTLSKGNHTVETIWAVNWMAQVSNVTRTPLDPPAACEEFTLSSYLEDAAGHIYSQNSPWSPGAVCDNLGNVTISGQDRVTILTNLSLATLTKFHLVAELDVFTGAFISAIGNMASAEFNAGTNGHYAKLVAIVMH